MCTQLFDNGDKKKIKTKHHKVGTAPKSNMFLITLYNKNVDIKFSTNEQLQNQIEK